MCLLKLTHSQYAHKAVVETISEQIWYFGVWYSTHICCALSLYVMILGIEYDVQRYITPGMLPFEEYSQEPLWTDEENW